MKNKNINTKIIILIVLMVIIISIGFTILNNKNSYIEKQIGSKEKLTESTSDNAYISMQDHLQEVETAVSSSSPISLGSGTSFDLSSYEGYENFTTDNFIIMPNTQSEFSAGGNLSEGSVDSEWAKSYSKLTRTFNYNASTGILKAYYTITSKIEVHQDNWNSGVSSSASKNIAVNAYLIPNGR